MTEYDFLKQELHLLKKSAECFKFVADYIRQRQNCPSKNEFEKGILYLDQLAETIYRRMEHEDKQ